MFVNDHTDEQQLAGHSGISYLSRYLERLHARTVVIEPEYNDVDYLDDYASYYVRCFPEYERFCRRLHFFDCRFDERHLHKAIDSKNDTAIVKVLQRSYLGFVVARPLPDTVVGRTLVATYPDEGRRHFPVNGEYKVSLFGIPLRINSTPYQQQDSIVSACATVAIWSALHRASDLFGTPAPRPMRITSNANRVRAEYGRSVPSHALTLEQMCEAINAVGLEPEVYPVTPTTPILSIVYSHLELGLPVIMGVQIENSEGHAIAITGASVMNGSLDYGEALATDLPLIGRRIDELFAHDDGIGPFAWIRVRTCANVRGRTFPIAFLSSWKGHFDQDLLMFPDVLVVPVHPKIRIRYLDIESNLRDLTDLSKTILKQGVDIEWEPRLQLSNRYKDELRQRSALSAKEKAFLVESQPRFIWCITLRVMSTPVADVIIDATDLPNKPVRTILWRHARFEAEFKSRWSSATSQAQIVAARGKPFFDAIMA